MVIRFIVCDHVSYHNYTENVMWNYFYCNKRKKPFENIFGQFFIDSGGFTCNGKYPPLKEYMKTIEIMNPDIFACQDLMCEPFFLKKTGKTLNSHIEETVFSYINICEYLSQSDLDLGYCIPVIQGWDQRDYLSCIDSYRDYGIELNDMYCAIGSVCLRRGPEAQSIIDFIKFQLPNAQLHGFGINRKITGLYSSDTALSSWVKLRKTTKNGLHSLIYSESLK